MKLNKEKCGDFLSLIVPFYNEGEGVDYFYEVIVPIIESIQASQWEIICVDDGSIDDTLSRLVKLSKQDHRFRILEFSRNFGKEAAITAGLDHARGDAVVITDADFQDPPEVIIQMVKKWRLGTEVVLGRRVNRSTDAVLKRLTANLFYKFFNRISEISLPEGVGDFRLMDRRVVAAIKKLPEKQRFMKGIFAWVGFRTETIDYSRASRLNGASKFSFFSLWDLALEGITSFSLLPLRLWIYVGGMGILLSLLFMIFFTGLYFLDIIKYYSNCILIISIFFVGSVQLVGIGIVGEYVGKIYMESKRRPIYLIKNEYEG
ncbi:glycosyltransferase [Saccharibacter sp. 17.LH.SD]|uniref:glycosyltransferase family 2 protein n=1 Tax=Saccharibacter sp. 17.LH.SD TaxID=2689393 RepID=UPI0013698EC9|nr:glycosyltransferase family 2 protein [Saccharibacter sp. 17.LH.SD]MXV45051.1 glycosyltransferase [Saccharibacter sp. 17.LH.SD]